MLRAIMTSHISENDLSVLTLQMNGTMIGHLDPNEATNRVISSNREVHLASGYYSSGDHRQERKYILEQNRLFGEFFSDLQTQGLAAIPELADKYQADAAFLLIAAADMVLIWQDRQKGVYLSRNKKLYRLQPVLRPEDLWAEDWMTYGDFYAFSPKDGDFLIFLSPEFIDQFNTTHLEEVFSSGQQVFTIMKGLVNLGKTYGFDFEQSWFALEIQRVEANRIYKGHSEENLSEEVRRISRAEHFSKAVQRSKASRVIQGQELILPKDTRKRTMARRLPQKTPPAANRPQLGSLRGSKQETEPIDLLNERYKQERESTHRAFEARRKPMDEYFEKVREWRIEPLLEKIKQLVKKFFNLWPDQKFYSRFFATSLLVLFVLLAALFIKEGKKVDKSKLSLEESSRETQEEVPHSDAFAEIPAETNLEIATVVKVNNLQIRQAKDSTSALLASVKRGEVVIQLTPEISGWIYVRTEDGTEGYVYAEYLNPQD